MFFISPVKAIYSIKFYLEKIKEPLWKAFLFFLYLFVLASVFLTIYIPSKMTPLISSGIDKVAEIAPTVTVTNGIITANNDERLVIEDKILQGYKIVFDTASTEPGFPTQMEKERILFYINHNAVYVNYNGKFQEVKMEENFNTTFSKQELLNHKEQVVKAIKSVLVAVAIISLFIRIIMLAILALMVVFLLAMAFRLSLPFKKMLILALYLQGPVVIFDFILALLPTQILGMSSLIALVIYIVYINFIYVRLRAESVPQTVAETGKNEDGEE